MSIASFHPASLTMEQAEELYKIGYNVSLDADTMKLVLSARGRHHV